MNTQKQLQLFLSLDDEIHWSTLLKEAIPTIKFLNDNVWLGSPDERSDIESCQSGRVYLFDGELRNMPTIIRKTGEVEGPVSGCVVQVLRPAIMERTLLSGRVAVGFDDRNMRMKEFVTRIWKTLKDIGKTGVVRPDGQIDNNYLVGTDIGSQLKNGKAQIRDRATNMRMQLPT